MDGISSLSPIMNSVSDIIKENSAKLSPLKAELKAKLDKLEGIKCVLFDVYGTLMVSGVGDISHSSEDNRDKAIRAVMTECGFDIKDDALDMGKVFFDVVRAQQQISRDKGIEFPEIDIREVWQEIVREYSSFSDAIDELAIEHLATKFELRVNGTWPMPYLESTLCALRHHDLKLGIVSNAQFFTPVLFEAYLNKDIETLGFDLELCQWSYAFKEAKPSTKMYRVNAVKLEAKYGIQPNEVLYVGNDMLNDVLPAYQTGFKTALFAGDQRSLRLRESDERLTGIEADLVVTSLDQIISSIC